MNKKYASILFFIGCLLFVIVLIVFYLSVPISYSLFCLLLFLSSCCMLPESISGVLTDENPTPVDWRILFGNIIGIILFLIFFIDSMMKGI